MKDLSRVARVYILGMLALTLVLWVGSALLVTQWTADAGLLVFLLAGAITAQYFTVVTPKHQHYYLTPAFFFAGIVLLDPFLFVLLVALAHVPEWLKMKYPWYIQSFNIAGHALAGFVGKALILWLLPGGTSQLLSTYGLFAIIVAASVYIFVNHLLVGIVLSVARNVRLRDSQVLSPGNLLTDLALACVGASIALLWVVQPWLAALGTAPLILIHRALSIPALREEAQIDSKTGLYNNNFFTTSMADELRRARRFGRPLAVIMSDLDGLRHINNTHGHLAGDAVLAVVGRVIREQVREYDVAARFGGEEFTLLMPETTTHEGYVVAERIRRAVESSPVQIPTRVDPIYVTITAGVASYPADGQEADSLIHAADVALYQGKAAGKNRVRMSTPSDSSQPPAPPPPYEDAIDTEIQPPEAGFGETYGAKARWTPPRLPLIRPECPSPRGST
jgi:diguanylate cyclase (GGDEF)-like protein